MDKYIYGMHDPGEWFGILAGAGVNGWCVYTVAVGCDPNDQSGQDFGVPGLIEPLARINNGYAPVGTIPHPNRYPDFAKRVANFVRASKGCRHWIVGNEIAMNWEFPDGQPIRLSDYIQCFKLCRDAIKAVQPDAVVIPQAPAPYNDGLKYPGNERGDWCQQLTDMLNGIGVGNVDGIALHAYTHGHNPALVSDEAGMGGAFTDRHYHFRTYRDFMQAIPAAFRQLPVFITEANPCEWQDVNNGWIQAAYAEIDQWNNTQGNQRIHCLCFYRWQTEDGPQYHIRTRQGVIADFQQAVALRYVLPEAQTATQLTQGYTAYVTAPSGLMLRSEPNTQAQAVTTLTFASAVQVLEAFAGWLRVQAGRQAGWVYAAYTSREKPVAEPNMLDATIEHVAQKYNLDPKLAKAVMKVEAGGHGFVNGRLIVRFEPRVWLTMRLPEALRETGKLLFAYGSRPQDDRFSLNGTWKEFHGNQALEHLAIAVASAVDRESAIESASYGLPQVMGFNYATVGYTSAEEMVKAFEQGEEAQVDAFFAYCDKRRDGQGSALEALRSGDYVRFARMYNGVGQEEYYAGLIRQTLG